MLAAFFKLPANLRWDYWWFCRLLENRDFYGILLEFRRVVAESMFLLIVDVNWYLAMIDQWKFPDLLKTFFKAFEQLHRLLFFWSCRWLENLDSYGILLEFWQVTTKLTSLLLFNVDNCYFLTEIFLISLELYADIFCQY